MYPQIQRYMDQGVPATGLITVNRLPNGNATLTVTINGVVFTWRAVGQTAVTSLGSGDFTGDSVPKFVQSLVAAINGDPSRYGVDHGNAQPIGKVWAIYYGNFIRLIAAIPGTGGNSLTYSFTCVGDTTCLSVANTGTMSGGATS